MAKRKKESDAVAFWRALLNDDTADVKDRLKASEFLAKASKTFSEDEAVDTKLDITIRVVE